MSNSLVRKGLELLGYENNVKQEKKKKKKHMKYKGALNLIPSKHRIHLKKDKTDLGTVLGRSGKVNIHETQKRLAAEKDPTDENVQRLLLLSNNRIDPDTANKLLQRAAHKRYVPKKPKSKESEATAFTEEDFKKFEQEYMNE